MTDTTAPFKPLTATQTLNFLVRSRHTVIAISSSEEARVQGLILKLADKQKVTLASPTRKVSKAVVVWTHSDGLRLVQGEALPKFKAAGSGDKAQAEVENQLANLAKNTRESAAALRTIREWHAQTG